MGEKHRKTSGDDVKVLYINPIYMRKVWDESVEAGQCSPELLACFEKIAAGFSKCFYYTNDYDRRATISHAVSEAWINWHKFNPEKTENIFSFFTTCIANWMRQYYNNITKHKDKHISLDALLASVKR